ncbi:Hpt domain-containing protein [bacterium]|nr:Hpt domain-containing protein [bacterium]MBU1956985.1 Hpt domain-containing protein [bacterium]
MYYGYNDNKQLIMADEAFIELLGYTTFNELIEVDIINRLKFENKKISIEQKHQKISADFMHHEVCGTLGEFYLVELKNINVDKTHTTAQAKLKTNYKAIYLDVDKISEEIGLSVSDYKLYLDSFIDQSIIDEKRLLEGNDKVIKNLSNLALTLKIPHINILLLKIQKLSHRERMPLIDQYYTKLALLTLEKPEDYDKNKLDELFEKERSEDENKEEVLNARFTDLLKNISDEPKEANKTLDEALSLNLDLDNEPLAKPTMSEKSTEIMKNVPLEKKIKSNNDVKEIVLDNVLALPISYSPQTAADELNLPVVLIEEFVDDFIEQARHDKDHLLASYYQKDMDNIHELGHKLKGAASNLRINELADILEEIQFCSDHDQLEPLFIKFWGHFLSLEDYMKQISRA